MASWKKVSGYEEYEVSDAGEVSRNGKVLKKQKNKRGQHTVSLSRNGKVKTFTVSRLVAKAFLSQVPEPVLCKKNPCIIDGGNFVDDRGVLTFFNSFSFTGIKRFYQVENTLLGTVRAWHGHLREGKFVYVPCGTALVGAALLVQNDNMLEPGGYTIKPPGQTFVLSDRKPSILFIPPGYANGFKTLTDNTIILFFSTTTLEESKGDDIRFDWNIIPGFWEEDYR